MGSLEDKIRPSSTAKPWRRELCGALLLIALTLILIAGSDVSQERYFSDVLGQVFSYGLLPALGLSLALRCGAIDLSIWAVSSLAGAVVVWSLRAGLDPAAAMMLALAVGLLVGALNGVLVWRLRAASPLVTLISAAIIVLALQQLTQGAEGRSIVISSDAFGGWAAKADVPPFLLRIFMVAGAYALVLSALILLNALAGGRERFGRGVVLFASLCASGALSALGGAFWLIDRGSTPIPVQLFGDLRLPAAAILAGAVLFGGSGRTMLVVLCLPVSMLTATIWRQEVVHLPFRGYSLQMILLIGMTIVAHLAVIHLDKLRRGTVTWGALGLVLTLAGILVLGCAAGADDIGLRRACHICGIGAWMIGAVSLMVSRAIVRRGAEGQMPSA